MNKFLKAGLAAACTFITLGACADTEQIDITAYHVVTQEPTPYTTPQGNIVMLNGQNHASAVAADGDVASQYCGGNGFPNAEGGGLANGAGFCTSVQANGDVLWIWYKINGAEPTTWGVIGGTGEYEGATGGGTSSIVSQGGDGRSWVSKATGSVTTP